MNNENLTNIFSFESSIGDDGNIQIPLEKLKEIKENGFEKVQVVLFGSAENAVAEKGHDPNLFRKIKEIQTLPDSVILDFLNSKGKLANSKFEERIKF